MRLFRQGIINVRVRRHFHAALLARPLFGGGHELLADALVAVSFGDIPAFDVTDRQCRVATVGVRALADFDESEEGFIGGFGDEDEERQGSGNFAGENRFEFARVFFHRAFGHSPWNRLANGARSEGCAARI